MSNENTGSSKCEERGFTPLNLRQGRQRIKIDCWKVACMDVPFFDLILLLIMILDCEAFSVAQF